MKLKSNKGTILVASYSIVAVLMILGVAFVTGAVGQLRAVQRYLWNTQSFYFAQAGVERVLSQFLVTDYQLSEKSLDDVTGWDEIAGSVWSDYTITSDDTEFEADYAGDTAERMSADVGDNGAYRVTIVRYRDPGTGAVAVYTDQYGELRSYYLIVSFGTAEAADDIGAAGIQTRSIRAVVRPNDILPAIDNAIQTASGSALWSGNFDVHWGKGYIIPDSKIPANNCAQVQNVIPDPLVDPWFEMHTAGFYLKPNGQPYNPDPAPDLQPYAGCGRSNAWQNQDPGTFPLDTIQDLRDAYSMIKQYAQENGTYYTTDGGVLQKNGSGPALNASQFGDELNAAEGIVFVDTENREPPPNSGGTGVLCNIAAGGNITTNASIYVSGTLVWNGAGTGQDITGYTPVASPNPPTTDPLTDQGETLSNTHVNGFIYTAENFDVGGNVKVYGAIIADAGYTGNGSPEIWYNDDLATGYMPPGMMPVRICHWQDRGL